MNTSLAKRAQSQPIPCIVPSWSAANYREAVIWSPCRVTLPWKRLSLLMKYKLAKWNRAAGNERECTAPMSFPCPPTKPCPLYLSPHGKEKKSQSQGVWCQRKLGWARGTCVSVIANTIGIKVIHLEINERVWRYILMRFGDQLYLTRTTDLEKCLFSIAYIYWVYSFTKESVLHRKGTCVNISETTQFLRAWEIRSGDKVRLPFKNTTNCYCNRV